MKPFLRCSIVPAILAGLVFVLHAQDADKPPLRGKVLLLKTGHAMEGDIEKVGSQYCVRRGSSQLWLAEDRVVRLCADWNAAYLFIQTQIKGDDVRDRLGLARWCQLHRMMDKALEQAQIALELQPSNAEARQLIAVLERALKEPAAAPQAKASAEPKPAPMQAESIPPVDVTFETQVSFATKIQPILMNKCATCHAGANGGKFHLEWVADSSQKAATQRNLAMVLRQVDFEHPSISPLIVKAVTRHGDALTPPLRDRNEKPVGTLHQWIDQTLTKNPQLREYLRKQSPASSDRQDEERSVFPTQRPAPAPKGKQVISQTVPRVEIDEKYPPRVAPATTTPAPRASVGIESPTDEFDALHFNRWAHPGLYQQQSARSEP
jgi:hypothetical protein